MDRQPKAEQRLRRVTDSEISLLWLWDVCLDDAVLCDWRNKPEFGSALRRALELLQVGKALSRAEGPVSLAAAGFEAVFLTGGGLNADELSSDLRDLPFPVFFGEGVFTAERGGFELLKKHGLSGWVADWGQSQLKLMAPDARWIFPRDWTRLRMPGDVAASQLPGQRRRLREFLALALAKAMADTRQPPSALVFALAGRVEDDGTPEGNTYAGFGYDKTLLTNALDIADLGDPPVLVLNDAELAAHSARLDPRLDRFRKVLVITLGFGIGAALIHRS